MNLLVFTWIWGFSAIGSGMIMQSKGRSFGAGFALGAVLWVFGLIAAAAFHPKRHVAEQQPPTEEEEREAMERWAEHMAAEGERTMSYIEWERERNREEYRQVRDIQREERI